MQPFLRRAARAVSVLQELFQRSAVWRIGDWPPLSALLPIKVPLAGRRHLLPER